MKKLPVILSLVAVSSVIAIFTGGCASYSIQPIAGSTLTNWCANGDGLPPGYIIYQPELYFAATITDTSQNQTVTVTPLYLPNYQKPYRLTTHNFLGKADFTFNIADGWKLTQIADKSDNTTVATSLAGQLKTILDVAVTKGMVPGTPTAPRTRTIVYRPVSDPNTGYFIKFEQVGVIADSAATP